MALDTFANLKTAIANELNRSDLTSYIPDFITLAEAEFKRDRRVRKLTRSTESIAADAHALPADFHSLESWYHDGANYYGPIRITNPDAIGTLKDRLGATGVPAYAAIVDSVAVFAPAPDATYSTKMVYNASVAALTDAAPTNWLLTAHPDAYLYGALVASAPFLKDDERIAIWEGLKEKALNGIGQAAWDKQYGGGTIVPSRRRAIGG